MKARAFVLSVAVLAASLFTASPRAIASANKTQTFSAYFNNPVTKTSSITQAIRDWLQAAWEACDVPNGIQPTVRLAVYDVNDTSLVRDIANNYMKPCLDVRVVTGSNTSTEQGQVRAALDGDDGAGGWGADEIRFCATSCFGTTDPNAKMHTKFMTINDADDGAGYQQVVVDMTSNWSDNMFRDQHWNVALSIYDHETLHSKYRDYFDAMWAVANGGENAGVPFGGYWLSNDSDLRLDVFPKASGDPVAGQISGVACPLGEIRVAMGSWNDARGNDLARLLYERYRAGCVVRIVVPAGAEMWKAGGTNYLKLLKNEPLVSRVRCTNTAEDGNVHSKYVLVEETSVSSTTHRVFMGSHNFTDEALRANAETWLKVAGNDSLYSAFESNFQDQLWARAEAADCPSS